VGEITLPGYFATFSVTNQSAVLLAITGHITAREYIYATDQDARRFICSTGMLSPGSPVTLRLSTWSCPTRLLPSRVEADGTTPTSLGQQMTREIIIAGGEPQPDDV